MALACLPSLPHVSHSEDNLPGQREILPWRALHTCVSRDSHSAWMRSNEVARWQHVTHTAKTGMHGLFLELDIVLLLTSRSVR